MSELSEEEAKQTIQSYTQEQPDGTLVLVGGMFDKQAITSFFDWLIANRERIVKEYQDNLNVIVKQKESLIDHDQ